ncbi:MAG: helix-turn-helix domain-containing protein [Actinomycetia bacterium]|nr:helix-turn-helix domain-containing protein [Actinomycetes bacterium]
MQLGTNIRNARRAKGMSTTQLGYHLDRTAQTIHAYESGSIVPPLPVVQQLAEILDVSIDDLVADVEFSSRGGE